MQRREQKKINSETRKNADVVRMIPIIEIEPHPNNVRKGFDEGVPLWLRYVPSYLFRFSCNSTELNLIASEH